MIIYPAIDVIEGNCVRLVKGDFAQKTVYERSPAEVAKAYHDDGAEWLHLVDLDGARDPKARQVGLIADVIKQSGLKVQTGGGIRGEDEVKALLDAGASRVVIGSLAVRERELTKKIIATYGPDKICLAMDVLQGDGEYVVAVSGWQESGGVELNSLIREYEDAGLKHLLCTDISLDGTMKGCNKILYDVLKHGFPEIETQASGGVAALSDIRDLSAAGVIIGKALYEGAFTLREALEAANAH